MRWESFLEMTRPPFYRPNYVESPYQTIGNNHIISHSLWKTPQLHGLQARGDVDGELTYVLTVVS
jgi:hypothetical protein